MRVLHFFCERAGLLWPLAQNLLTKVASFLINCPVYCVETRLSSFVRFQMERESRDNVRGGRLHNVDGNKQDALGEGRGPLSQFTSIYQSQTSPHFGQNASTGAPGRTKMHAREREAGRLV